MKRFSRTSAALACALFSVSAAGGPDVSTETVRAYRQAHEAEIISEFVRFLSIPNVASDSVNIRKNADALAAMLRKRGIETRLLEGGGPPVVFGELRVPGATRTIAFYAHYDGQPADPETWASPPFSPTLRDGSLDEGGNEVPFPRAGGRFGSEWRLYARGVADDKGPIMAILAALDAIKAAGRLPTANLKFFFEGEEEEGSPNLEELARRHADILEADAWICADGPMHQTRRPTLFFGVRGIVTVDITVYGPNRGLHSGHYGNWAPNPAMRLATLLAGMKDSDGRVTIEGFYDDVEPLGEEEKEAIAELPDNDAVLMREFGLAGVEGGGRKLAHLINEPSLNIAGLRSEYVGRDARTIVPAEATASLDLRLVRGNDPDRQVRKLVNHISKQGYHIVTDEPDRQTRLKHALIARVVTRGGYRAVRTPMNTPIARKLIAAVQRATGQRPIMSPTLGGSVPLWILEEASGSPQIGIPIVNHDNNQHAANENLRIQNLWDGIEIYAAVMTMRQ